MKGNSFRLPAITDAEALAAINEQEKFDQHMANLEEQKKALQVNSNMNTMIGTKGSKWNPKEHIVSKG